MTKTELLRKLRDPAYCYVRVTRAYYDGSQCFDLNINVPKGEMIRMVQNAPSLAVFNVEIQPKGTGYAARQRIIIRPCLGQPGRNL